MKCGKTEPGRKKPIRTGRGSKYKEGHGEKLQIRKLTTTLRLTKDVRSGLPAGRQGRRQREMHKKHDQHFVPKGSLREILGSRFCAP